MSQLHWITADQPPEAFPPVDAALAHPPGLLAAGGDLSVERLLAAYRRGIFPWYESGQPILWWCPDPRAILIPEQYHVSRSLRRTIRRGHLSTTVDRDFDAVVRACAAPRPGQQGTWITPQVQAAFCELHRLGWAHSVETWHDEELAGGVYGLSIGRVFFAESMFSRVTDASKLALLRLTSMLREWNFPLIDCQIASPHLASLGMTEIPRRDFVRHLDHFCNLSLPAGAWQRPGR